MVVRMAIRAPSHRELAFSESQFTFERPRHRVINAIVGLTVEAPGLYACELFIRHTNTQYGQGPAATFPLLILPFG